MLVSFALLHAFGLANDSLFFRFHRQTDIHLNNGQPMTVAVGDCYPMIDKDASTGVMKFKFGGNYFFARGTNCALVPESEVPAAAAHYREDIANTAPRIQRWDSENSRTPQTPAPAAVAPVVPATITVEPTYYWNVEVVVGRKYAWTADTYERYKTFTTEVQAKSQSEAESIAARKSYTTRSNLIQSTITVEPAGTKDAKFRVTNCTARRQ